jgi:Do/DeqQ family serine protease
MKRTIRTIGLGIVGGLIPLTFFLVFNIKTNDSKLSEQNNLDPIYSKSIPVHETSFNSIGSIDSTLDFTYASSKSINSVVHINTTVVRTTIHRDPFYEFFYGPGAGEKERKQYGRGSGSGVIVTEDGYIVTNNHVIDEASEIEVTLNDNNTYKAKVIGTDPSTDLAIIKIETEGLTPMAFGNSDEIQVGEWVLAVGNPFNLTSTVTAGIVSAKARNINIIGSRNKDVIPIESFIQTDAAVNPGNSGGALVNISGELIGINTAIASQTGSYTGYSFAIPSRLVNKVMIDLIDFGMVQRGFLGVQISPVNQSLIDEKELPDANGVYIAGVNQDSGAKNAGIKEGDVILKVGNRIVNTPAQLQEEVGKRRPGDQVKLTIRRNNEEKIITVTLKNIEGTTELISKAEVEMYSALGATFEELSREDKKSLDIDHGVRISTISTGKLKALGLTEGMIITKINNDKIKSIEQLTSFLKNNKNKGVLLEVMTEGGKKDYVGFGL